MVKKLLAAIVMCALMPSLSVHAVAYDNYTPIFNDTIDGISQNSPLGVKPIEIYDDPHINGCFNNAFRINPVTANKSGKTLKISEARAGYVLGETIGSIAGRLTSENNWDYYVFSSSQPFYSVSQIVTNNPGYTLTLGIVDWSSSTIQLTDFVVPANEWFVANFEQAGDYAWVIESSNATYNIDYLLQYNRTLPVNSNAIYATSDLQKIYSIAGKKLKINNQVENIDYKLDVDWEYYPPSGGSKRWQELHIWMEDANVSALHVGGVRFKAGLNNYDYPNTIVLLLEEGGWFTHYFSQSPPYINLGYNDIWGELTPRAIHYTDIASRGSHYLIYNLDTGRVVEFVSGLSKEWSSYGDKSEFRIY